MIAEESSRFGLGTIADSDYLFVKLSDKLLCDCVTQTKAYFTMLYDVELPQPCLVERITCRMDNMT